MIDLFALLEQGLDSIIPDNALATIAAAKTPLKIKFGADPSAPDLHLGHMVVLNKLRLLQDLGHHVHFLIGDFTALIGDPTGKSETRKPLSEDQVRQNAETYQEQVFKILDPGKTTVVYNSHWLSKLSAKEMIELSAKYTVARMLERDDFHKRFTGNQPISVHEFLYPLLQGYDSVELNSDVEFGGTDQTFNLLMGRHLQKEAAQKQQLIFTVPILEGLDGVKKMSKSLNNHIGLLEAPTEQFGKMMSLPDSLICRYYTLLTTESPESISQMAKDMESGTLNPRDAKIALAKMIITRLHSSTDADHAATEFAKVFAEKELPSDIPEIVLSSEPVRIDQLLAEKGNVGSKKEIGRLIKQGAVSIDGETVSDMFYTFTPKHAQVIKVGKRRFMKLVVS